MAETSKSSWRFDDAFKAQPCDLEFQRKLHAHPATVSPAAPKYVPSAQVLISIKLARVGDGLL